MNIKRYFLVSVLVVSMLVSSAQESIIGEIDYAKLEKLIVLAKEHHPQRKILKVTEKIENTAVTMSSLTLLNGMSASYFYRPPGRAVISDLNPFFFNGFQFGIGVNLSSLVTTPMQVKQAKRQREIAQLQSEDYDRMLETMVKARYYSYIQLTSELKVRTQTAQDMKTMFERIQNSFELGEVDFDTYTSSRTSLSEANSAVIATEVGFMMAKDELESLIGVRLEDIN